MRGNSTSRVDPSCRVAGRPLSRFEHLIQTFPMWEGQIERLTCGRFEAAISVGSDGRVGALHAAANQSLLLRGRDPSGGMVIALVLPGSSACLWQHRRLDAGRLVVRGGDVEIYHRTSRPAVRLELSVGEDVFRATAQTLVRVEVGPIGWFTAEPDPAAFNQLESRIRRFLCLATDQSAASSDVGSLGQSCLRAAVEALYPVATRRPDLPLPARTALVNKADALMRANLRIPLGEIDLCAALAVGSRTFRRAFRERFDLGPMAYYQAVRLNAVRLALKTAKSARVSIQAIAREHGFAHLGKFSGYYHRMFGELPSETVWGHRSSSG